MTRTRKLIIVTGVAAAAVAGGAAIAVAQQDPGPPDLDRAAEIAREAAGDGEVVAVEQDDDGTYDVEIRRADGTETEIDLSPSFDVTRTEEEHDDDDDSDDVALDEATRRRAADAAMAEVGEGVVVSVESDDGGYEVEIRHPDGTESEVQLDTDFTVVHTDVDDD